MIGTTGEGWLYSLKESEESNWGDIDECYDCIDSFPVEGGSIIVDSPVWGRLYPPAVEPVEGDGIGFYHSSRARFPAPDPFGGRPRISLMGTLLRIKLEGRSVTHITAAVDPELLDVFRTRPIVRDASTRHLFEQCGIVRSFGYSLYRADAVTWSALVALLSEWAGPKGVTRSGTIDINAAPSEDKYTESKRLRLHLTRERNRKAVRRKKQSILEQYGNLVCEVCGFDFAKNYGSIGEGFAECHHLTPLSEIDEGDAIELSDLAIVCSNCHRMLHRRPFHSIAKLRELILAAARRTM